MKIAIIAAMQIEAEKIIQSMENTVTETISNVVFTEGTLPGGASGVVAVCGIGKVLAALCTQTLCLRYHPDVLIHTGIAGSLSPELSICDVAISTAVVQHDMDTSALGDPVGWLSGPDCIALDADAHLVQQAVEVCRQAEIPCRTGIIASGDQFVASPARKRFIAEQFHAISCEMEGAAVGEVCAMNGVPFVILRAISDSADGEAHMDYPTFAKKAAEQGAQVVLSLVQRLQI